MNATIVVVSVKGRKNLAVHVRHWRERARLSQLDLARVGGPSVRTLVAIDEGLRLPAGTAGQALAGEDVMDTGSMMPTVSAKPDEAESGPGAADSKGVFEDLARLSQRVRLRSPERIAVRELLQTAKIKEQTLMPLVASPEVAGSLNALYRESVAELAALVERSFVRDGR